MFHRARLDSPVRFARPLRHSLRWKPSLRRAITLLEVLVAVSVIGIMLGLLLPAVQGAREAVRRSDCSSSLRQISLAVQQYAEAHRMYPATRLANGGIASASTNNCYSIYTRLLPYLGEIDVYEQINFDFTLEEHPVLPLELNRTARQTRIATLLCPSETNQRVANSFRFNTGLYREAPGPIQQLEPLRLASLPRGAQHIAFVSERTGGSFNLADPIPAYDIARRRFPVPARFSSGQIRAKCARTPVNNWYVDAGRFWFFDGTFYTIYNHNALPNERLVACEIGQLRGGEGGLHGPRSWHSGGVNVTFGDGHVDFISDSVSQSIWEKIGSIE